MSAVLVLGLLSAGCGDTPPETAPTTTISSTTTSSTTTTTSSTTTTTSTTVPDPSPSAPELCALTPLPGEPVVVESALLTEISGIAFSRRLDGLIWAHNDSGGSPRLHLLDADTGADLGTWPLSGAAAFDWEDMAIGPGPTGDHLYAADIGDNFGIRREIHVYRVTEPAGVTTAAPLETEEFVFRYPEGPTDAEAFLVDPSTGDFVVISKTDADAPTTIYRAPANTRPDTPTVMEKIGEVDLTGRSPSATAADITTDGRVIGIRTSADVLLWDRAPGQTIADALTAEPCRAPVADERQGEAFTFLPDGSGYVTISEGEHPPIHRFAPPRP